MKKFDEKLKECAAQARRNIEPDTDLPFRFADRVLNRLARPEEMELADEGLWLRFGLRTLVGVTFALLVLSLMPSSTETSGQLLPPPIEHSIVDYSGLL